MPRYVLFRYAAFSSLHFAFLHSLLSHTGPPSCLLPQRKLWRLSFPHFPHCCLPHFPYERISNCPGESRLCVPHSCRGFLSCCLVTSHMCAVLLHQLSSRQSLSRMYFVCGGSVIGKLLGSACAAVCSKSFIWYMLLCSYYINPLSWTLYGIIVTQLGDETNLVSAGNQPEICCLLAFTCHCTP